MSRKWNMTEIPKLREKLHAIRSHEQQRVAEEIIDLFESAVLFSEHKFSKGVIHGDFNDCNILVNYNNSYASRMKHDDDRHPVNIASPGINNLFKNEETHSPDNIQTDLSEKSKDMILNNKTADAQTWHVNGVIDFGDSTQSLYLFEVAIAIVHVMMNMNGIPALDAGSYVLAGYVKHINFTHIEINHLKLCICARFVQSLVLGYFSITQDPDNSYILNHAQRVWPVLKSLWETSNVEVVQHLTEHVTKY
uniref:Aminoglycoside phosphotransferase domain-containing protein n=2 Tax=Arion vulgaris TaxID=1028688 RepID=A0A0B7B3J9_9EUPU